MIYFVALSALVYQLTGSSLAVAGALMSMTLPTLLAPVSGFLIDRWPFWSALARYEGSASPSSLWWDSSSGFTP
jgi:hypothetical protein